MGHNTQFSTAYGQIVYELDGVDSVDMRLWRLYVLEMLPFYSSLLNLFLDAMLKYDLAHPLKQLAVCKAQHDAPI